MVAALPQDDLHSPSGPVVHRHRTAQIHRALPHRVAHHAQRIEAQLLAALHLHGLQLAGGQDGGIVRHEGKGVHCHKGQLGGRRALEAQQAALAPLKGEQEKFLLLLKAKQALGKAELLLLRAVNLAKILGA